MKWTSESFKEVFKGSVAETVRELWCKLLHLV